VMNADGTNRTQLTNNRNQPTLALLHCSIGCRGVPRVR
jgi:hypothetical protein